MIFIFILHQDVIYTINYITSLDQEFAKLCSQFVSELKQKISNLTFLVIYQTRIQLFKTVQTSSSGSAAYLQDTEMVAQI